MQSDILAPEQYELTLKTDATALLVLAHGSSTHLASAHLAALSQALGDTGIATLRFNFGFRMAKHAFPGPLIDSIADFYDALQIAHRSSQDLPIFIAGHSYGGRVMTHLLVDTRLKNAPKAVQSRLKGGVAYSLPLHPKGKPSLDRWQHLSALNHPLLVLAGDRDPMITQPLAEAFLARHPDCTLHWVNGADHGLHLTKKATDPHLSVYQQVARRTRDWIRAQA